MLQWVDCMLFDPVLHYLHYWLKYFVGNQDPHVDLVYCVVTFGTAEPKYTKLSVVSELSWFSSIMFCLIDLFFVNF